MNENLLHPPRSFSDDKVEVFPDFYSEVNANRLILNLEPSQNSKRMNCHLCVTSKWLLDNALRLNSAESSHILQTTAA